MHDDQTVGLDRRAILRRIAAGSAAVWSTPILHSVASAQALPSCAPGLLDWDTFATDTLFTSAVVGNVTVAVSAVPAAGTTLFPTNGRVRPGPAGGLNEKYVRFEMEPDAVGVAQTITISFSSPVTNLAFRLFDIDAQEDSWRDEVFIDSNPGYTWSVPPGSSVVKGSGANVNRFRNSDTDNNVAETDNDGNLHLGHPGPLTSFVFVYRNGNQSGGQNQWIGLGDLTFTC